MTPAQVPMAQFTQVPKIRIDEGEKKKIQTSGSAMI